METCIEDYLTAIELLHLRITRTHRPFKFNLSVYTRNTTCNVSMHITRVSLSLLQSMNPQLDMFFCNLSHNDILLIFNAKVNPEP